MKAIIISLPILALIFAAIVWIGFTELSDRNRVLQSEVDGLRKQNHFLLRRNGQLQIENTNFRMALDSAKIKLLNP